LETYLGNAEGRRNTAATKRIKSKNKQKKLTPPIKLYKLVTGNTTSQRRDMNSPLDPIITKSLKEVFVEKFSSMILSGKFHIGEKLPSERDLAEQLGVSRPVVHEGLVHLQSQGLVTMQPRKGTVVNDYRKTGSLTLFNTLLQYGEGIIEKDFLKSMLQMRKLLEIENARLAAENCTMENLNELKELIYKEETCNYSNISDIVALDFDFHHMIAIASGNLVYPLIINSFRQVYTNLTKGFFKHQEIIREVIDYHKRLIVAIERKNTKDAAEIMSQMLEHGEKHFLAFIK